MSELKTEAAGGASKVVVASAVEGLPILLDKAIIKSDQDVIRVNLTKLDAAIHANAVQCMLHAQKHGDTSLFRRLVIDIIDDKTGYRRQALIGWMREFSPMELSKDVIKLTGTLNDLPRPWRIEEANKTPFWLIKKLNEQIEWRPVFRDNLVSKLERALREFKNANENTKIENGKVVGPIDATKPFYDGIHLDKVMAQFDTIEHAVQELNAFADNTKDVRVAASTLKRAQTQLEHAQQ